MTLQPPAIINTIDRTRDEFVATHNGVVISWNPQWREYRFVVDGITYLNQTELDARKQINQLLPKRSFWSKLFG